LEEILNLRPYLGNEGRLCRLEVWLRNEFKVLVDVSFCERRRESWRLPMGRI
jgi:hypothetical protein